MRYIRRSFHVNQRYVRIMNHLVSDDVRAIARKRRKENVDSFDRKQRSYLFLPILRDALFFLLSPSLVATQRRNAYKSDYRACRYEIFTFSMRFSPAPSPLGVRKFGEEAVGNTVRPAIAIARSLNFLNDALAQLRCCASVPGRLGESRREYERSPTPAASYALLRFACISSFDTARDNRFHTIARLTGMHMFVCLLPRDSLHPILGAADFAGTGTRWRRQMTKPKSTRSTRGIFLAAYSASSAN